ncbi:hypothetical protein B0H13DRAFT_2104840 [Mycena leptocephala]|jgi:hypothetical protein|nr:hypothetical protein B0H13DRAFT_2104840 [Mycena leptocephala]
MRLTTLPSLTLLALTLATDAASPVTGGRDTDTLAPPHTPGTNTLWQRWFALPPRMRTRKLSDAALRVRRHGPRRRTVHP